MYDLEPIPVVEPGAERSRSAPTSRAEGRRADAGVDSPGGRRHAISVLLILVLAAAHGVGIWIGMGGLEGLSGDWPLWRDDHPLYFHSALVTRAFLRQSGTTAGYDPSFMAGYPKSVVFPASSTLPELVVAAFGGKRPALAYKLYVLISAGLVPWLFLLSGLSWRLSARAMAIAMLLFIIYVWTGFPINYAEFGMLPYLLAIPLGLLTTGVISRFLERGGFFRWLAAALLASLVVLVHLTSAMIVFPAAVCSYIAASVRPKDEPGSQALDRGGGGLREGGDGSPSRVGLSMMQHLGAWLIPLLVLVTNAFWWLPGVWLSSTKGKSDFAFAHPEGITRRLFQLATAESPVLAVLLAIGVPGLVLVIRQQRIRGASLLGFSAAGFFWGYLAGESRSLDFLQPGRHTYALFTGLALAGGVALDAIFRKLRTGEGPMRSLDRWALAAMIVIGVRMMGVPVYQAVNARLFAGLPFLTSRPPQRLLWIVDRVRAHVRPGERLLYEESGFSIQGLPDPYQRGRFSGLLPERTGVEVIGGPYLHASLQTNFTQFGEGRLFGKVEWNRDDFVRYAGIYRPAAILCWTPYSRQFCQMNPDLVTILEDDGTIMIGRVKGFPGDVISGSAVVQAEPGRLRVREPSPGLDGWIVLRYHSVPSLRARPPVELEEQYEAEDPVPFIRLRPPEGVREVELELITPLGLPWLSGQSRGS